MSIRLSPSRARIAPANASAGLALVAVLWIVAALSVLITGLVANSRADLRGVYNLRAVVEHTAVGDGAITLAAAAMLAESGPEPVRLFEFRIEDRPVNVEVLPAAAFIDLNLASQELLRDTLWHGAGLAEQDAQVLAERIVDWRDVDEDALPNGAENAAYEAAGSPFRPRNGPFESVDDLIQVLGVSLELHDKLRGLLTIHSDSAGVDPRYAPPAVLTVLAAGNADAVDRVVSARLGNDPLSDMTGLTQKHLATATGRRYRFDAWRQDGNVRLSRVRWLDLARPAVMGVPWTELGAEPVVSARMPAEAADGT